MQTSISEHIKSYAKQIGFDSCGLTQATLLPEAIETYKKWLNKGYAAEMNYAHNHLDIREDITLLLPDAKTVLVTLSNYYPHEIQNKDIPQIAKYAYGKDYHKVLLKMHQNLLSEIQKETTCIGRIFIDSAPVLERTWAVKAGLGFIGKNGMLISPSIGVHTLISGIVLDIDMDHYDHAIDRNCGRCSLCIDHCPSKAIVKPQIIDANKCLSYLSIEHRGEFKENTQLQNRIFGCDTCIDICPYNKRKQHQIAAFMHKDERLNMNKTDWENMDEEHFNILFNGTPIKRTKYTGIKRNLKHL